MTRFLSKLFSWIKPVNIEDQELAGNLSLINDTYFNPFKQVQFISTQSNRFPRSQYYVSTATQTEARKHVTTDTCGTMTDQVDFPIDTFDIEPYKIGKEIPIQNSIRQPNKTSSIKYGFQAPISKIDNPTFDFVFHSKESDKTLKNDQIKIPLNPVTRNNCGQTNDQYSLDEERSSSHTDYSEEETEQYSETNNYSNSD